MWRVEETEEDVAALVGCLRVAVFRLVADEADTVAIASASEGLERVTGWPSAELVGGVDRLLAHVASEDRGPLRAALHAAAVHAATCDMEFRLRDGRGGWRRLLLSLSSDPAPGGGCAGMLVDLAAKRERPHAVLSDCDHQIARQKEIIELLHDVAATANDAPDARAAMGVCLERLCGHGGWPIGHVYRVDESDPGRLLPTDLWYLADPVRFAPWDGCTRQLALTMGEGLPGRVFASGLPEWIVDVGADAGFLRAQVARDLGIRTGFAIPVRIGMEVVAVLEFFSPEAIPPDPLLFQALAHIGIQIGRVVERDRATRNLRVVGELAQAASRAKTNFLANMSHELRTPLNAIIGFADAMMGGLFGPVEPPQYGDYARYIHSAGRHLLELVNDILDLSRIEARRMVLNETPVDVGALLDLSVQMLRPEAEAKGIAIRLDRPQAVNRVLADELRLRQVVLNLLTNAIRATPERGRINLSVAEDLQHGLMVTVADTGCGMTADEVARAMRPFESSGPAHTSRTDGGVGLGLPLSKALVELHGGHLELKSEKGRGTTATIRLPPGRVQPDRRSLVG